MLEKNEDIWEEYQYLVQQAKLYAQYCKRNWGKEILIDDVIATMLSQNTICVEHIPASSEALSFESYPTSLINNSTSLVDPIRVPKAVVREDIPMSLQDRFKSLQKIEGEAKICTRCAHFVNSRTQVVFSSGPIDAELAIIGEAPGKEEDLQGVPFVGPSGNLLTKMLSGIQIQRDAVYITNVVKCRPVLFGLGKENRTPTPEEIKNCFIWLKQQFHFVRPLAILVMGSIAAGTITGRKTTISAMRASNNLTNPYRFQGIPIIFTYHPSYLLRCEGAKRGAWLDLNKLKTLLLSQKQATNPT